MSKNYVDAVEQADVLFDYPSTTPEQLVALGYRAALKDAVEALQQSGAACGPTNNSAVLYAINRDKLAALARKSEARAKELKV